jgi:hypothetical protein
VVYWCLGMYSSASTWAFNLVQKLAAAIVPDRPVTAGFVDSLLKDFDEANGILVAKTHATPIADELARRASAIVVTVRDPRDAIASQMLHSKTSFDRAVRITEESAVMCARFMTDARTTVLRFEDRFFDDPATVQRVSTIFDGALSESDNRRIFAETRREKIEEFIAEMHHTPTFREGIDALDGQQYMYDEVTCWHKHHAGRKAETGLWRRELSLQQVRIVEDRMANLMLELGYRPTTREHHLSP